MSYYLIQIVQMAAFTGSCALLVFLLFMAALKASEFVNDRFNPSRDKVWPGFLAYWMVFWTLGPALALVVAGFVAYLSGELAP